MEGWQHSIVAKHKNHGQSALKSLWKESKYQNNRPTVQVNHKLDTHCFRESSQQISDVYQE